MAFISLFKLTLISMLLSFTMTNRSFAEIDQITVVYISVKCEHPETGARSDKFGTGSVITKGGHVVTAAHVISCQFDDGQKGKILSIKGHIGSPHEAGRKLDVLGEDERADIAVLQFLGVGRQYKSAKVCRIRRPAIGSTFSAAGFPAGHSFQIVKGIFGTNIPGGRWSAASAFAEGMSGGPIVQDGFVIGIIKGGNQDMIALRTVTPLYRGKSVIEQSAGIDFGSCVQDNPPALSGKIAAKDIGGIWQWVYRASPTERPERTDESSSFWVSVEPTWGGKLRISSYMRGTELDDAHQSLWVGEGRIRDGNKIVVRWYDASSFVKTSLSENRKNKSDNHIFEAHETEYEIHVLGRDFISLKKQPDKLESDLSSIEAGTSLILERLDVGLKTSELLPKDQRCREVKELTDGLLLKQYCDAPIKGQCKPLKKEERVAIIQKMKLADYLLFNNGRRLMGSWGC